MSDNPSRDVHALVFDTTFEELRHALAAIADFPVGPWMFALRVRLMTKESRSRSIAYSITKEDDDGFRLAVVYKNEPEIELQEKKSEIHHGAYWLEIFGDEAHELKACRDRLQRGSFSHADTLIAHPRCFH